MIFLRFSLMLGCGLSALASLPAAATQPATTTLPTVVVTAHTDDAPLVTTLDPRAPAQPIPAQDGADLLKAVPGFSVIRKGGADGDPVLRGMAGSRLGIVLDHETLLGGCGQRMDPPTAYVFPAAFDQVTILKGPQTVLHGPGQSAGIVHFERTPRVYEQPAANLEATATIGSFGRNDQALNLQAGTPLVQVNASASRNQSDDYQDGDGRTIHSAYERWNTTTALAWTPDANTRVELSTAFSDGEAAYADRMMDGSKFARRNLGLALDKTLAGPLLTRVQAKAYHNDIDHVMDNYSLRTFAPTMMMPNPAASNPDRETYGGRAQFTLEPADRLRIETGLDLQSNRHSVRNTANQTATPYQSLLRREDARFDQIGVFAEATRELTDHHRLILGARLDDWRAQDTRTVVPLGMMGTAPNPTARAKRHDTLPSGFVRWEAGHGNLTSYAGVGHTQRFPDYWELFSKETATTVSAFNTDPEKTTQLDIGVIRKTDRTRASLSLFAGRVDDYILIQSGVAKGMRTATIARNIDATTLGGEAAFGIDLGSGWNIDTSLAYVRGDNETDDLPLAQQPPLEGRVTLGYTTKTWSLGALTRLVAEQNRFAINQGNIVGQDLGPSDGFVVCSLNATWRPRENLLLSAGADNLFDTTYAEHISRGGANVAGFPAPTLRVNEPGRVLWLRLDLSL
ncbi:MAG: TonB-dependent copper receptor [Verrucomicrobiota bacterium]